MILAGPPLPALDRSGRRRTSSASSGSQWASPDLHCQLSIAVGLAGPQPASRSAVGLPGPGQTSTGPQRLETKPNRMPKRTPDRTSEDMPDRMSEDMSDRMSEDMPDRMSEDMPGRMSEDMPDGMPERHARQNVRRYAR